MRVLVAEFGTRLQDLLRDFFGSSPRDLAVACTLGELHEMVKVTDYDVLIVDLAMTDDGANVIRAFRDCGDATPILAVSGRDRVDDRIAALDAGADDYLIEPFKPLELIARVRSLMRRPAELHGPVLRYGDLELEDAKNEVRCNGIPMNLRLSERSLLRIMMRRAGDVVLKKNIEEAMSQFGRELTTNAVEALISHLRKSLATEGAKVTIETVHGVGYRLKVRN